MFLQDSTKQEQRYGVRKNDPAHFIKDNAGEYGYSRNSIETNWQINCLRSGKNSYCMAITPRQL
jgi:hypothetical protein